MTTTCPDRPAAGAVTGTHAPPPDAVGLGELLRSVRPRLGAAIGLQAVAAVVAVVPFAAVAELARVLLADDPVDQGRTWTVAAVATSALVVWLVLTTAAGAIAHRADLDFQLSVRRRLVDRLGRVPLGWFTDRGAGGIGNAVQHDVDAMHHLVSGGERQRISIARALLKNAPIVLFDEATAALDAENEHALHHAMAALSRDRTVLVIAHRLQTVRAADHIVVLAGGRAVEQGDHEQLLARDGRYAGYWRERRRAHGWRLTDHSGSARTPGSTVTM